jgi:mRNA interferase RelE/StbE
VCAYQIQITSAARRDLGRLAANRDLLEKIDARILSLANDPRPHNSRKLSNEDSLYRVRVGDYRIIYQVRDETLVVLVVRVRHRREVYEHL